LKALCDALMDNPADGRGLSEWAEQVGASERTLARLFQSELDTSFGAWRQQLRLAKAVDEISRGVPMAQVAAAVGYASQAAFSAMFAKALGVPPSRFTGPPG
ncbi:AraC family transcriptional regulator, partial [Zoogloea sp.]|uniref:helix-turn-helix domain-containing protein n=1 Tax=Zoogloea sp. TaxID=49181 RepID=UPI001415C01E